MWCTHFLSAFYSAHPNPNPPHHTTTPIGCRLLSVLHVPCTTPVSVYLARFSPSPPSLSLLYSTSCVLCCCCCLVLFGLVVYINKKKVMYILFIASIWSVVHMTQLLTVAKSTTLVNVLHGLVSAHRGLPAFHAHHTYACVRVYIIYIYILVRMNTVKQF